MRCKRKFQSIRVANADEWWKGRDCKILIKNACKRRRVVGKIVSSYALQTQISKHPRYKRGRVAGGVGRIILVLKTTKPLAYCERLCCCDSVY